MATTTVASILTKVSTILQDSAHVRWTADELLLWLNEGQRELVLYKPNSFVTNESVKCSAGTKQIIPANAVALVDIVRNMGTNGTTPGGSIRTVSREILDTQVPNWHAATPSPTVKHFVYNALDSKTYYVYPPQPTTNQGYVEMAYTALPADAVSNGTITVDDIYSTALISYVLFRSYSKDAEYAGNATLASTYYQQFQGLLQGKVTAESAANPNQALGPFNPSVPGSMK
jgi:hypothetical protein